MNISCPAVTHLDGYGMIGKANRMVYWNSAIML